MSKYESAVWVSVIVLLGLIVYFLYLYNSTELKLEQKTEELAIKAGLQQCPNPSRHWQLMWQKECSK